MDYEMIMKKITSQLTGDSAKDFRVLKEQAEEYKTHELANEILRGIGRLIYEIIPQDKRKEFGQVIQNDNLGTKAIIEEVQFQIYKKNYHRALDLLEEIINKIESMKFFSDDTVSQYCNFDNLLEEILYKETYKPKKEIRQPSENFANLYYIYGNLLLELQRYDEALVSLQKAMKWNPVKTDIIFELGEIYKLRKQLNEFLRLTKLCLEFSYSSLDLARCYRNLGYYYIEKKEFEIATALFILSIQFDEENKTATSELLYISQLTGKQIEALSSERLQIIMKKNKIQIGANPLVINIAYSLGCEAKEQKNFDASRYFYGIIFDLTGGTEVKDMIENLSD